MRLGGNAAYLTDVLNRTDIVEALAWAEARGLPAMMIGGGSNIIWDDDGYPGLVLVNKISGFDAFEMDELSTYVTVGAGEDWDSVVSRVVDLGLSGIEQLSLIPGTAGATPVQNVGAYGREIAEVLVTIELYDTETKQFATMRASECEFGYRTSKFKTTEKGRYFISAITMLLQKQSPKPPFYDSLQTYLDKKGISSPTLKDIRESVIAIRSSKLPDPKVVANNGSFFANPIITADQFREIQAQHEEIPHWQLSDGRVKLAAGWMIEQTGFKGVHDPETGMATWDKQALVLVNEKAKSTRDLLVFKQKIINAVQQKFGVVLEQEPELV